MPQLPANGIHLEYDTFGDPAAEPMVLIMGLSTQMIGWPELFCQAIADEGFHVIRFDNRDSGLSTLVDAPAPDFAAISAGDTATAPYLLADMAADTVGLLDALDLDAAHIVGASMGGMIAQQIAISHPARVRSLCSIMSTPGVNDVARHSSPEVHAIVFGALATTREEVVTRVSKLYGLVGSPSYPTPLEERRHRAGLAYDRSFRPAGTARQLAAILASPDRTEALRAVRVPAAVVHGDSDGLIHVSAGRATAAALDVDAQIIPGAGHDLPAALWDTYVDAIVGNARRG